MRTSAAAQGAAKTSGSGRLSAMEDSVDTVIRILNTVLDDDGLQVRRLAESSKGLFTTQTFQQGEVLWKEPPLLAVHAFDCPVPACQHCLRALRSGEEVECPGSCGHRYCSDVCQGKARIWYHCVVCSCDQREPSRGNRLLSTLMTGRMMTKVTKRSTPGLQSMCAAGSSSLSSAHGGVYPPDF